MRWKMKKGVNTFIILVAFIIVGTGCGTSNDGFNANGKYEDVIQYNKDLENEYMLESFPYYYAESKDLITYYQKVMEGEIKNYCLLTLIDGKRFKETINADEAEYVYFGEIEKQYPEGKGVLFHKIVNDRQSGLSAYCIAAIADFDEGYISGYALCYDLMIDSYRNLKISFSNGYEGEYDKGTRSGEGIYYWDAVFSSISYIESGLSYEFADSAFVQVSDIIVMDLPMVSDLKVAYIGEFLNDQYNGEGIIYNTDSQMPKFIGKFKRGKYAEGKLYSENGSLLYEGEFKDGKYHGKGILYNEDGSIEYEGKFKKGDIK